MTLGKVAPKQPQTVVSQGTYQHTTDEDFLNMDVNSSNQLNQTSYDGMPMRNNAFKLPFNYENR